jgi:DNA-binding PadR family transcriptional regulator
MIVLVKDTAFFSFSLRISFAKATRTIGGQRYHLPTSGIDKATESVNTDSVMNDLILLAALCDGPKHGWALKKLAGFIYGGGSMHNNLLYPLLKKFVAEGWVRRREEAGQRGQTRAVYSLTPRGRRELLRRLAEFGPKQAGSAAEFRLRVGLFGFLEPETRARILSDRDRWLEEREKHFTLVADSLRAMRGTEWGQEVSSFLLDEARRERKWIRGLARKPTSDTSPMAGKTLRRRS